MRNIANSHISATVGCEHCNGNRFSAPGKEWKWLQVDCSSQGRLQHTLEIGWECNKDLLLGDGDGGEGGGRGSFPDHCVAARHRQGRVPAVDGHGEVESSDYALNSDHYQNREPDWTHRSLQEDSNSRSRHDRASRSESPGLRLQSRISWLPPTFPLNILDRPTA